MLHRCWWRMLETNSMSPTSTCHQYLTSYVGDTCSWNVIGENEKLESFKLESLKLENFCLSWKESSDFGMNLAKLTNFFYLSYISSTFQLLLTFPTSLIHSKLNQKFISYFPNSARTFQLYSFQFHNGFSNLKLSNFSFFQLPFPTTRIPYLVRLLIATGTFSNRWLILFEIMQNEFTSFRLRRLSAKTRRSCLVLDVLILSYLESAYHVISDQIY